MFSRFFDTSQPRFTSIRWQISMKFNPSTNLQIADVFYGRPLVLLKGYNELSGDNDTPS